MPIAKKSTNLSGSISNGGQSQLLAGFSTEREGLLLQNTSSGDLWVNDGAPASAASPSLKLESGTYYEWPYAPRGPIYIFGATGGQTFTCREF